MVEFCNMRLIIQEWFADHSHEGLAGIARVYTTIICEAEKQLDYFGTQFKEKDDAEK